MISLTGSSARKILRLCLNIENKRVLALTGYMLIKSSMFPHFENDGENKSTHFGSYLHTHVNIHRTLFDAVGKKQKCWLVHSLGYTDTNRTEQKSAHAINPVPECPSWSDVGVPMGAHATGCSRWICVGRRAVGVNQHLLFVRCAEVRPHVDNDPDGMQSWHPPIARARRIDPLVMIIVRLDWKCVLASLHCLFGLSSSGFHVRFVTKMYRAREN